MNELEFYDGAYTGQQIDSAIGKVVNADSTPTANSTNMITSGGVKSAFDAIRLYEESSSWSAISFLDSKEVQALGQIETIVAGMSGNAASDFFGPTESPSSTCMGRVYKYNGNNWAGFLFKVDGIPSIIRFTKSGTSNTAYRVLKLL